MGEGADRDGVRLRDWMGKSQTVAEWVSRSSTLPDSDAWLRIAGMM